MMIDKYILYGRDIIQVWIIEHYLEVRNRKMINKLFKR